MMTDSISLMVTVDREGFGIYRVRGPYRSVLVGRHYRKQGTHRLLSSVISGLYAIPYNLFAVRIFGRQFADKKLHLVLKSSDDQFLEQLRRLDELAEASPEWDTLRHTLERYELTLKKVSDSSPAMQNLRALILR